MCAMPETRASFPRERGGRPGWGIVRGIAPIPSFPRRRGKEPADAIKSKVTMTSPFSKSLWVPYIFVVFPADRFAFARRASFGSACNAR